jgi:pimeloyl-ACP methyl ester carboxylesterase
MTDARARAISCALGAFAIIFSALVPASADDPALFSAPPLPQVSESGAVQPIATTVDELAPAPCPPSQLWVVSSRNVPMDACPRDVRFTPCVQYYDCRSEQWIDSSLAALLATNSPDIETVIFVHGNRTNARSAQKEGVRAFRNLGRAGTSGIPVRFLVWSWPSNATFRTICRDALVKSERTDDEAFYFGSFLQQLGGDQSVTLVGFSFGARIITGSLHLLAGGQLNGSQLGGWTNEPRLPYRAALLAAALDSHWLAEGQRHGLALTQVDEMFVTVNDRDFILKTYPRLSRNWHGGEALGAIGPSFDVLDGPNQQKLVASDVNRLVHHRHFIVNYLRTPEIMAMVRNEIDMHRNGTLSIDFAEPVMAVPEQQEP